MSLSFVSKAVLTPKEGGDGYEETPIESTDDADKRGGNKAYSSTAQPLFDQLRTNKEREEQEREEFQKSIMRGTLALDEEDCAHLDAVQKQRQERQQLVHRETESELEAFRAAQAVNRIERGMNDDNDDDEPKDSKPATTTMNDKKPAAAAATTTQKPLFPAIIVKKRKKVATTSGATNNKDDSRDNDKKNGNDTTNTGNNNDNQSSPDAKQLKQDDARAATVESTKKPAAATQGISALLAGYGSDDSDSD